MLIYIPSSTARTQYIFSTLSAAMGVEYKITTHVEEYLAFAGPRINYSNERLTTGEVWIEPVSLLYKTGVHQQDITCFEWSGVKAFFASGGDLPFDVFAAAFYLLTRYEEYLPHKQDMYGRYAHENSIAYRNGFLHQPLINLWLQRFEKILLQKFPALQFSPPSFAFTPTYDIDIAWGYRHKGFLRNAGGFAKALTKGRIKDVFQRLRVLLGKQKDPFDVYDWLDELHRVHQLQPIYFFLLAQQNKGYDKNILPSYSAYQQLVKRHAEKYNTGIHPSWQSGDDDNKLQQEIHLLASLAGNVVKSRQHYIRMTLPKTYRRLLAAGIQEDYSMGYGSINGFRASYCLPYKWYDLEKDEESNLLIFPFCYMEANSLFEQHYSAAQAFDELKQYYEQVKQVNGHMITIFHNHLLSMEPAQLEWRKMYERFLQEMV
ncbi:polysaccharide deacetylase family protein [Aridibaculum aurantiacum]|uniref:polysaccharide deacetylase family protein n=1 Tax=Aridibaculum aurantiacum TaxID=2810307 RepID=UPI001A961126|nr:polysaccharide deacetylase family protein [Aridibaculum aurantiacum]